MNHIFEHKNLNTKFEFLHYCFNWFYQMTEGPFCSWLYGSCIYNYLCSQYLSQLKLWVRIPTTTYAISAYHHWCCEFESRWGRGVQHYVITIVSACDRSVVFSGSSGFAHQLIWTFFILNISKYSGCFKCVQILYSTFCVQTISMIHSYTIVLTGFNRWLRCHCGRVSMRARYTTLCDHDCQCLGQVGGFLWVLRFRPPIKLTATIYSWLWPAVLMLPCCLRPSITFEHFSF
jgi:hypothetical protein